MTSRDSSQGAPQEAALAEAEAVEEEVSEAAEAAAEDLEPPAEEEDLEAEAALEEVSQLSISTNVYFQVAEEPTSEA